MLAHIARNGDHLLERLAIRDWLLALAPGRWIVFEVALFGAHRLVTVKGGAGSIGEALLPFTGH
jgi:hypothetical protein